MPILTTDQTGDIGELIAALDISRPVMGRYKRALFKPTHLGGKYPTVDFIVDVLATDSTSLGFFFMQVKSTTPASATTARLSIDIGREKFNRLAKIPAPTYLVGVDINLETSYLVTAYKPRGTQVSSITKAFSLRDDSVKINLYKEVIEFWVVNRPALQRTWFKDV